MNLTVDFELKVGAVEQTVTVTGDAPLLETQKAIQAVNVAADESRTVPLTMEQLESFGLKLKGRDRPNDEQRQRDRQRQLQLADLEQSQKLWQQILFVAIAIVLLETLVSGWSRKQTPA